MNKVLIISFIILGVLQQGAKGATTSFAMRPDTSGTCYSAVLDTAVNPYSLGIAGNWHPSRTFTYYGARTESDARINETDIRKEGTFASFIPFWNRQADSTLQPVYDTSIWVWNAQSTLFNEKGFEVENKDPLGRYNAGLYGYDHALPVAVIQNARYRESMYEGFEDYDFGVNVDTACVQVRSFDYSPYKKNLDSTVSHTGKYAIRIAAGGSAAVGATVVADDPDNFDFNIQTGTVNCYVSDVSLKAIRADNKVILPSFSPFQGKRMVVGLWVKEAQYCACNSFTHCNVSIKTGTSNITALPSGNIIEGWQRIEQVVDIPANATTLTLTLNATGSTDVYFDDIRIHPYNANMKSFAYDPVLLRLMGELDENNYATFYEYDDDGTLIRVKKETERGIKTISETRSALIKE
ncbi:hypothetical protein ACDQ55_13295 [Chitinophaga sp. 30R24]|uniref:hypothetical protein n=1 Tax=Chitinophaga sp. 30R24 TaxID=3248838 RepID=UPI003B8ED2AA